MKILVTGSAGFIGFHLVNKLTEKGYDVIGLDQINSYYDKSLKINRLKNNGINSNEIIYNKSSKKCLKRNKINRINRIFGEKIIKKLIEYYLKNKKV